MNDFRAQEASNQLFSRSELTPPDITEHANINLWFVAVVVVGVALSASHNCLEQHSAQAVAVALWLFVVVVTCATPTLSVHRTLATYFHHPGNRERPEHQRFLRCCHGHPSFVLGSCEAGLWVQPGESVAPHIPQPFRDTLHAPLTRTCLGFTNSPHIPQPSRGTLYQFLLTSQPFREPLHTTTNTDMLCTVGFRTVECET